MNHVMSVIRKHKYEVTCHFKDGSKSVETSSSWLSLEQISNMTREVYEQDSENVIVDRIVVIDLGEED